MTVVDIVLFVLATVALWIAEQTVRLRLALRDYGRHDPGCPAIKEQYPCTCGWRETAKRLLGEER